MIINMVGGGKSGGSQDKNLCLNLDVDVTVPSGCNLVPNYGISTTLSYEYEAGYYYNYWTDNGYSKSISTFYARDSSYNSTTLKYPVIEAPPVYHTSEKAVSGNIYSINSKSMSETTGSSKIVNTLSFSNLPIINGITSDFCTGTYCVKMTFYINFDHGYYGTLYYPTRSSSYSTTDDFQRTARLPSSIDAYILVSDGELISTEWIYHGTNTLNNVPVIYYTKSASGTAVSYNTSTGYGLGYIPTNTSNPFGAISIGNISKIYDVSDNPDMVLSTTGGTSGPSFVKNGVTYNCTGLTMMFYHAGKYYRPAIINSSNKFVFDNMRLVEFNGKWYPVLHTTTSRKSGSRYYYTVTAYLIDPEDGTVYKGTYPSEVTSISWNSWTDAGTTIQTVTSLPSELQNYGLYKQGSAVDVYELDSTFTNKLNQGLLKISKACY